MAVGWKLLLTGLAAVVSHATAQVASVCPVRNVCFQLNIPEQTASSGDGDIYFQISAPDTYEYVALGQGQGMSGANIFVVYTSGNGNVTLSPRLGTGHVMPQVNNNAQVTLLEGSGVSNGKMVANVRCSSCNSWRGGSASFSGSSGNWIYAVHASGGPKDTTSQSAAIQQHDEKAAFQWEYAQAKGGASINPFLSAANPGSGNTTGSGGNGDDSPNTGFSVVASGNSDNLRKMLIAHGTLAALAFVILFPFGSIAIRLASFSGAVWLHGAFQLFAYVVYIVAFGLGIHIAREYKLLSEAHPIIGIVVFVCLFFQPVFGLLHHSMYKKHQRRTAVSHVHIWLGRLAITLGIINGGLGFQLADRMRLSSKAGMIAYGVVAGVVWLVWVCASMIGEKRRRNKVATRAPKDSESTRVVGK